MVPPDTTICLRARKTRIPGSYGHVTVNSTPGNWRGSKARTSPMGLVGLSTLSGCKQGNNRRRYVHSLDSHSPAVLDNHLVNLGVAGKVQIGVNGPGGVNVRMGAVAAATGLKDIHHLGQHPGVGLKPQETLTSRLIHLSLESQVSVSGSFLCPTSEHILPLLRTVASPEILQIVNHRDPLGLSGPEEVVLDRVHACQRSASAAQNQAEDSLVAKRDLDGPLKPVSVAVVRCTLVGLVLPHERQKLVGSPSLGLEVVIIGCRSARVHLGQVS